jgi:hypothetical protein
MSWSTRSFEAQNRVQLDSVRSSSRRMRTIPEANACNRRGAVKGACSATGANECTPSTAHSPSKLRRSVTRATGCRKLNDQRRRRVRRVADDQVNVAVVLVLRLGEDRADAKNLKLHVVMSAVVRDFRRLRQRPEIRDRGALGLLPHQRRGSVSERLYAPALDATGSTRTCGRRRGRPGEKRRRQRTNDDKSGDGERSEHSGHCLAAAQMTARRAGEPVPAVFAVADLAELSLAQALLAPTEVGVHVAARTGSRDRYGRGSRVRGTRSRHRRRDSGNDRAKKSNTAFHQSGPLGAGPQRTQRDSKVPYVNGSRGPKYGFRS